MAEIRTVSEIIEEVIPYYKKKGEPEAIHTLVYDSSSETLEPIYFFVLDLMNDFGLATEKLVDNFTSSPGSGHFAELGGRATAMQQQASNTLANIGTVLRGVLTIIYDLKEFRIRLQHYDDLKSKNKDIVQSAKLALKQVWLDKVDFVNKGNSSIKAMALGQAGFGTLLDGFLVVNEAKDVTKLDINDIVKRILFPRIQEFNLWLDHSEKELRKRYELERTYLRSQVNNLKLYSRWVKPYLRAAAQLEMKNVGRNPDLVKTFSTILLELSLFGRSKLKVDEAVAEEKLPEDFKKLKTKRDYYICILTDFKFRGLPSRLPTQQSHYVFGGRTEMTFRAYALNDEEIKKIEQELDDSDLGDVLQLIEGTTTESMGQLQEEINFFLEEKEKEKTKRPTDTSNPFLALVGHYDKPEKLEGKKGEEKEKAKEIIIKQDSWIEKNHLRPLVAKNAVATVFKLFDVYKKAHGMPSYT